MAMIVERSMSDGWLTNTYLVAAGPGSDAFLVDAGGPLDPLFAKADEHGLNVTHILLTHHHGDHVRRSRHGAASAGRTRRCSPTRRSACPARPGTSTRATSSRSAA